MDSYNQPKMGLSGGFTKKFLIAAADVTSTLITCPQTTPSDHPKKHTIRVQRVQVTVTTGSAKTWTLQDSASTPVALTYAMDTTLAGTKYTFDFGPQGFALTLNKNLQLAISAAGAAGCVEVEGFYERDTKSGTYLLAVASPTPVTPASGAAAGGTAIRIFGQNFRPGCTVTIGAVACTKIRVNVDDGQSGASIDCLSGAHAAGAVDIVITNPDTTSVTATSAFTYA